MEWKETYMQLRISYLRVGLFLHLYAHISLNTLQLFIGAGSRYPWGIFQALGPAQQVTKSAELCFNIPSDTVSIREMASVTVAAPLARVPMGFTAS